MKTITLILYALCSSVIYGQSNSPVQFQTPSQFVPGGNTIPYFPPSSGHPIIKYQIVQLYHTNFLSWTNITQLYITNNITNTTYTTVTTYVTNIIYVTNNPANSSTNYVVANSGSFSDIQYAINVATTIGAPSVYVPPGTNQWTNAMGLNIPPGISLYASNTCSILLATNLQNYGLYINCGGGFTTISNFLFDLTANGPGNQLIGIDGSNVCFRITHCTFLGASTSGYECIKVSTGGQDSVNTLGPWGLIDHCNFYLPDIGKPYNIINIHANGYFNNYGWYYPMTYGTINTVVIENCNAGLTANSVIGSQAFVEGFGGGRACIRYCNITNIVESTHGTQSGTPGVHVSFLQLEMYENYLQYNNPNVEWTYLYLQRGGSSIVWSNTWVNTQSSGNVNSFAQFWAECAELTSSCNWSCESCIAPAYYPTNYPLSEQVGQGMVATNVTGYEPVYFYSNTIPATFSSSIYRYVLGVDSNSGKFIKQGIDVFTNDTVAPLYTPLVYPHPLDQ